MDINDSGQLVAYTGNTRNIQTAIYSIEYIAKQADGKVVNGNTKNLLTFLQFFKTGTWITTNKFVIPNKTTNAKYLIIATNLSSNFNHYCLCIAQYNIFQNYTYVQTIANNVITATTDDEDNTAIKFSTNCKYSALLIDFS